MIRFCARWLLALALIFGAAQSALAERYAFVVGMTDYTTLRPLKNAVQDARLMAKTLEDVGFTVELVENLPKAELEARLTAFRRSISPGATVLVYFAGHGIQYSDENYLIPADADIQDTVDLPLTSLSTKNVLEQLYASKAESVILVLDACRNNPLADSSGSAISRDAGGGMSRGLARISGERTGTMVAFATAPGDVAMDGTGGNSPYTIALTAAMMQQGNSIEQVFKEARAAVVKNTSGKQVPWENSSLLETIVLLPVAGQPAVEAANPCDLAAAHPADPGRVGPSVDYRSIDPQTAIPVCEAAVAEFPDNPRFKSLLARVYDRAGRGEDAYVMNEQAMAAGYLAAWHNMGNLYQKGLGVPKDDAKAYELYLYAAERGHPEDQHNIGIARLNGRGVEKDEAEARVWFSKAADQNWSASINMLGLMAEKGQGGPADATAAVAFYDRSVNLGNRNAMVNLANAYRKGVGVAVDAPRAVALFERSALQNTRAAFISLAQMYEAGEGIDADISTAAFWYSLAAREGDEVAVTSLQRVKAALTPEQLEDLRLRLEDWDLRQFG